MLGTIWPGLGDIAIEEFVLRELTFTNIVKLWVRV